MASQQSVILSAVRTPTGKFLGALKDFSAPDLGALVVREAVARAGVEPQHVDECIMGNVVSAGIGQNPARQAALHGGVPHPPAAPAVNMGCGARPRSLMLAGHGVSGGG